MCLQEPLSWSQNNSKQSSTTKELSGLPPQEAEEIAHWTDAKIRVSEQGQVLGCRSSFPSEAIFDPLPYLQMWNYIAGFTF